MYLADKGFSQDREDIKLVVKSYITLTSKNTLFKDDKPAKDWCISFEKRWIVVLGIRKPELSKLLKSGLIDSKLLKSSLIVVVFTLLTNQNL